MALVANPAHAHIAFKVSSIAESPILPRARRGEEYPDQVRIQSPRVLRLLFR
jgi:hypothetical protein